jgi:NTE family protein
MAAIATAASLLAGCALRPINPPLATAEFDGGYRWSRRQALPDNDPDTLFVLVFSGGGTRAAAFSYGVLEALRDTPVGPPEARHAMLSEVDLLTGVSGGSFTALSFGLYGDRLFDSYEEQFLKRNVESELIKRLLNPLTWPSTWSSGFGRSELAEQYYDEILFHGATFGDLIGKPTPTALVSATAVATGAEWVFSQTNFDIICSDMSQMHLARAAAASSAVPVVMSPVTLNNYAGRCDYRLPPWLTPLVEGDATWPGTRLQQRVRDLMHYADSAKRPYLHLVDGGLADNLALYAVVGDLQELAASARLREAIAGPHLRRIAIVVVNARSAVSFDYDEREVAPSAFELLMQAVSVPIDRFSSEAIYALEDIIQAWRLERQLKIDALLLAGDPEAASQVPSIDFSVVNVSFDALPDAAERQYLLNLPTSLFLSSEAVDRLRVAAAQLLRDSVPFRQLVRTMNAPTLPAAAAPGGSASQANGAGARQP